MSIPFITIKRLSELNPDSISNGSATAEAKGILGRVHYYEPGGSGDSDYPESEYFDESANEFANEFAEEYAEYFFQ